MNTALITDWPWISAHCGREAEILRREAGPRLSVARQALGLSVTDLAKELGASVREVLRWEGGRELAPIEAMISLRHRYGVSIDWIYGGDMRSLSPELARKIRTRLLKPTMRRARLTSVRIMFSGISVPLND